MRGRVEVLDYSEEVKGQYTVPVPEEVANLLDLELKVSVYPDVIEVEGREIVTIVISKIASDHKLLDLQDRERYGEGWARRYRVTIPKGIRTTEEFDRVENPFYGIEPGSRGEQREVSGDTICCRADSTEGVIRIFAPSDYRFWTKVMEGQSRALPAGGVLASILFSDEDALVFDLATDTPYEGQEFELIPYDPEQLEEFMGSDVDGFTVSEGFEEGFMEPTQADEISISWNPSPESTDKGESTEEKQDILSVTDTSGFRVVLPANGRFRIDVKNNNAREGTALQHQSAFGTKSEEPPSFYDTEFVPGWPVPDGFQWRSRVPDSGPPTIYLKASRG